MRQKVKYGGTFSTRDLFTFICVSVGLVNPLLHPRFHVCMYKYIFVTLRSSHSLIRFLLACSIMIAPTYVCTAISKLLLRDCMQPIGARSDQWRLQNRFDKPCRAKLCPYLDKIIIEIYVLLHTSLPRPFRPRDSWAPTYLLHHTLNPSLRCLRKQRTSTLVISYPSIPNYKHSQAAFLI